MQCFVLCLAAGSRRDEQSNDHSDDASDDGNDEGLSKKTGAGDGVKSSQGGDDASDVTPKQSKPIESTKF
jgi:hypothetical protein